jgi:sulfite exporter TauE/SafE
MIQSFTSAFFLGLISSLHCVGMCGPLVLALPTHALSHSRRALAGTLYHGGRILIYSLAGVVFGLLGRGIYLAGWQQQFSMGLGVLIVLFALLGHLRPHSLSFFAPLQQRIVRLWTAPGRAKFLLLGMANGLLPCGMVYLAIAGALTRTQVYESAGFMAFFGAGTLPLLLALQFTGHRLGWPARARLRRVIPVITILVGLLLILRGLDLGIPFLSPALAAAPGHVISCH